jgi:hypothetical protein
MRRDDLVNQEAQTVGPGLIAGCPVLLDALFHAQWQFRVSWPTCQSLFFTAASSFSGLVSQTLGLAKPTRKKRRWTF